MSHDYPVFLDLSDRLVAVVGGGAVAEEKVAGLLAAGARVRIVAEKLIPTLAARAKRGDIDHIARAFRPGDLDGAFLVLAERIAPAVDRAVWNEAERLGIPANVQDDLPHCSFIAPSIVRRGDLTVAISTAGKAPVLAVRLRQWLERRLGHHHARFLEIAGRLREAVLERHPDFESRRTLWYRLVDSDVLPLLERGEHMAAEKRAKELLELDVPTLDTPSEVTA